MLRQSQACVFYCDNPLKLLCIYNVSFKHISFLIKYSFEERLPTLSSLSPAPLHCPLISLSVSSPVSVSAENMKKLNHLKLKHESRKTLPEDIWHYFFLHVLLNIIICLAVNSQCQLTCLCVLLLYLLVCVLFVT